MAKTAVAKGKAGRPKSAPTSSRNGDAITLSPEQIKNIKAKLAKGATKNVVCQVSYKTYEGLGLLSMVDGTPRGIVASKAISQYVAKNAALVEAAANASKNLPADEDETGSEEAVDAESDEDEDAEGDEDADDDDDEDDE